MSRYSKQIYAYGIIKTAVKQGDKEKPKNLTELAEKNRRKEICLNCTQPNCDNRCKVFKKRVKKDG